jgi:D-serine deaminase-like pyridoxal phosphate-dependent protein
VVNKPTSAHLVIDEKLCRAKIRAMATKARDNQCVFRPHFKTHDNLAVGRWYREEGIGQMTVSSMKMAQKFADDGWKDIFVAVPVNLNEIDWINRMAREIELTVLIEDASTVNDLANHVFNSLNVRIEVDAGYHRTGIRWNDEQALSACVMALESASHLTYTGFSLHAGNSYTSEGKFQIQDVHEHYAELCGRLKQQFSCEISVGDTPTCSVAQDFSWADEMRPGNFIYYDLMQESIGIKSQHGCDVRWWLFILIEEKLLSTQAGYTSPRSSSIGMSSGAMAY